MKAIFFFYLGHAVLESVFLGIYEGDFDKCLIIVVPKARLELAQAYAH